MMNPKYRKRKGVIVVFSITLSYCTLFQLDNSLAATERQTNLMTNIGDLLTADMHVALVSIFHLTHTGMNVPLCFFPTLLLVHVSVSVSHR